MKLMNEIQADEDMEIIEVLVADGEMVEYGQPLFAGK
jgi:acetyl-CoA carboxylase biotin carboxyl carrier protein